MQTIQSVALGTKVALFVGMLLDKLHILVFEELFFAHCATRSGSYGLTIFSRNDWTKCHNLI